MRSAMSFDAGMTDARGDRRSAADILAMNEIVEEFLLGDEIGSFVEILDQHAHGAGISLPTALAEAVYLHEFLELNTFARGRYETNEKTLDIRAGIVIGKSWMHFRLSSIRRRCECPYSLAQGGAAVRAWR